MFSSPSSSSSSETNVAVDLGRLRDVVCNVDVVLGTGSITVRQCLSLKDGSIIRLEQAAGSDLQVVVNGVPVALGEVVIVEDSTAVRLTDILPPPSAAAAR
jgi:flagellar motor switch protein FliN/FliY